MKDFISFDEAANVWPAGLLRKLKSAGVLNFIEMEGRIFFERDGLTLKRIRESVGEASLRKFTREVRSFEEVMWRLKVALAMKRLSESIASGDKASIKADLKELKQAREGLKSFIRLRLESFFKEKKMAMVYFPEFYQEELEAEKRELERIYNRYIGHFYFPEKVG